MKNNYSIFFYFLFQCFHFRFLGHPFFTKKKSTNLLLVHSEFDIFSKKLAKKFRLSFLLKSYKHIKNKLFRPLIDCPLMTSSLLRSSVPTLFRLVAHFVRVGILNSRPDGVWLFLAICYIFQ